MIAVKRILFMFILILFYHSPVFQIVNSMILNILNVIYVTKVKPFKSNY
jgi:hypothetical protein